MTTGEALERVHDQVDALIDGTMETWTPKLIELQTTHNQALYAVGMALMVGTVQGGSQALSRSVFASMVPKHKSSEFFGFYSVFEKFAGILGPALFSIIISVTGSSRQAILSVVVFFLVGGVILYFVDLPKGQAAAREAEARAAVAS